MVFSRFIAKGCLKSSKCTLRGPPICISIQYRLEYKRNIELLRVIVPRPSNKTNLILIPRIRDLCDLRLVVFYFSTHLFAIVLRTF